MLDYLQFDGGSKELWLNGIYLVRIKAPRVGFRFRVALSDIYFTIKTSLFVHIGLDPTEDSFRILFIQGTSETAVNS